MLDHLRDCRPAQWESVLSALCRRRAGDVSSEWVMMMAAICCHGEIAWNCRVPQKTLGSLANMDLTTKHARWSKIGVLICNCIDHQRSNMEFFTWWHTACVQVNRLRKRLGTLVFFPWIQLEQAWRGEFVHPMAIFCAGNKAHLVDQWLVISGGFPYHFRAPNPNDSMFQYLSIFQKRNSQRSWNIVDTEQSLFVPSKSSKFLGSSIPRVLVLSFGRSAQANFALQLQNFDERTALCLIIHLAKKDPMDEKDPAEMGNLMPAKDFAKD